MCFDPTDIGINVPSSPARYPGQAPIGQPPFNNGPDPVNAQAAGRGVYPGTPPVAPPVNNGALAQRGRPMPAPPSPAQRTLEYIQRNTVPDNSPPIPITPGPTVDTASVIPQPPSFPNVPGQEQRYRPAPDVASPEPIMSRVRPAVQSGLRSLLDMVQSAGTAIAGNSVPTGPSAVPSPSPAPVAPNLDPAAMARGAESDRHAPGFGLPAFPSDPAAAMQRGAETDRHTIPPTGPAGPFPVDPQRMQRPSVPSVPRPNPAALVRPPVRPAPAAPDPTMGGQRVQLPDGRWGVIAGRGLVLPDDGGSMVGMSNVGNDLKSLFGG